MNFGPNMMASDRKVTLAYTFINPENSREWGCPLFFELGEWFTGSG
jgi:hypothetical protein